MLNIWDDDHLRNLDAARWIRVAWMCRDLPRGGGKGSYPVHGFPWAHLRYDLAQGRFVERPGLCRKPADLRKLVGGENYYRTFKDDPVAHLYALREGGEAPVDSLVKIREEFKAFRLPVERFLERFYIARAGAQVFGHYSPAGNFWFASAIRRELVDWLDPKPPAYR